MTRQEATLSLEQIDQSEYSIKQNTIYKSHLHITVLLLEGEPGSAYKVQKQQCYTLYLHTSTVTILYLYKDSAEESSIDYMNIKSILFNENCLIITTNLKTLADKNSTILPDKVDTGSDSNIVPLHIYKNNCFLG